jgi:hypothetical protein
MTRSLPALESDARAVRTAAKRRVFLALRALVALLLTLLQLTSALHFTLVPHTFSAALGGVVHVHGELGVRAEPRAVTRGGHSPALVAGEPSCAVELCPFADATHGSLPDVGAEVSGVAAFGAPSLLGEADARSPDARRVFPSAPKTSPPV